MGVKLQQKRKPINFRHFFQFLQETHSAAVILENKCIVIVFSS